MNNSKVLFALAALVAFSSNAYASESTTCSDSSGLVSVVDGKVTIIGGIGEVGPVTSEKVLAEISQKTICEGADLVITSVTVRDVTYNLEENVSENAVVLCTQVQSRPSKICNN